MGDANEEMRAAYHRYRLHKDLWYAFCYLWLFIGVEMLPDDYP